MSSVPYTLKYVKLDLLHLNKKFKALNYIQTKSPLLQMFLTLSKYVKSYILHLKELSEDTQIAQTISFSFQMCLTLSYISNLFFYTSRES